MSRRLTWVMPIPVISTLHLPGPSALNDAIEYLVRLVPYEEGWFIQISDDPSENEPEFIAKLRSLFKKEVSALEPVWIRLDADADVVEELPVFETDWESLHDSCKGDERTASHALG